jgi:hypothetical protein
MAPLGRLSSCSAQPIVGMLNCISGVSALTSSPVSVPNALNGTPAAGLVDRSTGSVSFSAAAQAAAPTFFSTAARWVLMSSDTGAGAGAEADGAGAGAGALALGAGAFSPPP